MGSTLLLLPVLFLRHAESSTEKNFKDTYNDWKKYQLDCEKNMTRNPYPTGIFCNRTFDMYACWEDGLPNTTVKVPCPSYLPWQDQVKDGFVFRRCDSDGQWEMDKRGELWRDHSQCKKKEEEKDDYSQSFFQVQLRTFEHFRLMYTIGYSLSLASLTLALFVLLAFRKLRCTRNYIHINLFASFMLRALSALTRDSLLEVPAIQSHDNGTFSYIVSDEGDIGCRLAQVLSLYGIGANYYWLLVEGLYLHNLLMLMALTEETYFPGYLLLGWGTPVLFVIPWMIAKYLYENTDCWEINDNMAYWWIIRSPLLLSVLVAVELPVKLRRVREKIQSGFLLQMARGHWEITYMSRMIHLSIGKDIIKINFFIFIRIIKIVISKLQAHQMRYTDYKFRLAKSTLALIPLLGIHAVVFAVVPDEQAMGILHHVKLFCDLLFSSFQVTTVAMALWEVFSQMGIPVEILTDQRTTFMSKVMKQNCALLKGLLVSVLYCFINKEVQAEIRKKWQRCQLGTNLLEKHQKSCISTSTLQVRCTSIGYHSQERSQRYDKVDYSSENSSSGQNQHPNAKPIANLGKKQQPWPGEARDAPILH